MKVFRSKYLKLSVVIKNNNFAGNVLSLKIYDPKVQQGTNACAKNKGNCAHLCLPISPTDRVCACATGYRVDPNDHAKCIGNNILF